MFWNIANILAEAMNEVTDKDKADFIKIENIMS